MILLTVNQHHSSTTRRVMAKTSALVILATLLTGALIGSPAMAQTRVFVAAQGADSNPCTFAAPCRTFQHAHDVVAAGGEIDVLDPAGYGAVTINKAISIQGHGFAGVSFAGGTAITISAGATDNINLRGLLIDGVSGGQDGIDFFSGASLNVQDCAIRSAHGSGIRFSSSTPSALAIANRSEEHTSELQSHSFISYAVF